MTHERVIERSEASPTIATASLRSLASSEGVTPMNCAYAPGPSSRGSAKRARSSSIDSTMNGSRAIGLCAITRPASAGRGSSAGLRLSSAYTMS